LKTKVKSVACLWSRTFLPPEQRHTGALSR
jgi:hypothetical protein